MKAQPDGFVVLVPNPWKGAEQDLFRESFEEYWQEPVEIAFDLGTTPVSATIESGAAALGLVIDEPIPQLADLTGTALEPFGDSELAMLRQHTSIWRLTAPSGRKNAELLLKSVAALVVAGASGAFLPNTRRLHSPRSIRHVTMEIDVESLTNFFVGAFDRDDWMRTRGLTAFGLPEVETPTSRGMNAAYFRIMDLAASMIAQGAGYPEGSRIQLGPALFQLSPGPRGPVDDDVPVNGMHGVITMLPV